MTEDFDLAVYVKGDRKPTAVYDAHLEIEYEGEWIPYAEGRPRTATATPCCLASIAPDDAWHMLVSGCRRHRDSTTSGEIAPHNGFGSLTDLPLREVTRRDSNAAGERYPGPIT